MTTTAAAAEYPLPRPKPEMPEYPVPAIVYSWYGQRYVRLPDGRSEKLPPSISQGEEDEQNENFWWPDEGPYWPH